MRWLVLFILLIPSISFGQFSDVQQRQIDSLNSIINSTESHDTSLAGAYLDLTELLALSNLDTVIPLCIKTKVLAENMLTTQLSPQVKKSILSSLSGALNNIGFVYHHKGEIDSALYYYREGLQIQEDINDTNGMLVSYNNIGGIHYNKGSISIALKYYGKNLTLYEKLGIKTGIAFTLTNIGFIQKNQGNYKSALAYYRRSLSIQKAIGDNKGMGDSYINIGVILNNQDSLEYAIEHYKNSLNVRLEIGDKRGIAECYNNIGVSYSKQDNIPMTLKYYRKSLKIREEIGDKHGLSTSYRNIAQVILDHGEQHEIVEASRLGAKSMAIAQEIGYPANIKDAAFLLSRIYEKQNQGIKALEMHKLYIHMRDSMNNIETQKVAIRQQTKYEFEKAQLVKEQEEKEAARILQEETSRRDNIQYSVILIALLVLGAGVMSLGRISVSPRVAEGLIFFSFLILFEFLLVLADPYIDSWSGGAPGIKLLFNAGIAALIFPLHSLFERKLKGRLINQEL